MPELSERITIDPGVCGGRPCIRGLRIRVADVLDMLAAEAISFSDRECTRNKRSEQPSARRILAIHRIKKQLSNSVQHP